MRRRAELIRVLSGPLRKKRTAAELQELAADYGEEELSEAVEAMLKNGTLTCGLRREWFTLSAGGRVSLAKGTLECRSLGLRWISLDAKRATVHVVVAKPDTTESHGSAFRVEDYPECVITAGHVIGAGNRILRIEDADGTAIGEPVSIQLGEGDLDLGILHVKGLPQMPMLRIDWDDSAMDQNDRVYVFGYPSLAGLRPGVEISEAEISAVLRLSGNGRSESEKSIVLSARNIPGHSGGPVLSEDGLVVGVVDQESMLTEVGAVTSRFSATPVVRLREVQKEPVIPLDGEGRGCAPC